MIGEQYLLLPGPTPVPDRVIRAMSRPLVNHRGSEFKEIINRVIEGVKQIYRTRHNVLIYPSSGTGGLEAAVVNFISPGERVLAISIGVFGDRLAEIANTFGAKVKKVDFPWGQAVDPQYIKDIINQDIDHEIKAILVTHNETSTGVFNDLQTIREATKHHPALFMVDAVSGLAAVDLQMDEWELDVVVSGSQKAFMIPPGLSFMAFNDKSLDVYKQNTNKKYYWDIGLGIKYQNMGQTPFTPPISLYYGLEEALNMMFEEGLDCILKRHKHYRDMIRKAIRGMGLNLLAQDSCASPVVTSVLSPENIGANTIRKVMQKEFNICLAGGQQSLEDRIIRIGHLGYVRELDLLSVLAALEITLIKLGFEMEPGIGLKQAQESLLLLHK